MSLLGHFRKSAVVWARSASPSIGLQKSKVAPVQIFGDNHKRKEESNWVPTQGKQPFTLIRFYGPKDKMYDKSFKLNDWVKVD